MSILIADSGSTKTDWCLIEGEQKRKIKTQGLSPYFLNAEQMSGILAQELIPKIKGGVPSRIFFYGAGCSHPANKEIVRKALRKHFTKAKIVIEHDLLASARALCANEKGIACILGTGSNSCYYNGRSILKNNPALGFILGDEGSGAALGKRLLQHYLYNSFDSDLLDRFHGTYSLKPQDILDAIYRKPFPNRFLAGFTTFLADNRGHYMVENIIEDGFNDFFYNHLYKYSETWKHPVHFTGSVAYVFRDKLKDICRMHEITLGKILKSPLDGLVNYHQ